MFSGSDVQANDVQQKALVAVGEHPLDLFSFMARRLCEDDRCALATRVSPLCPDDSLLIFGLFLVFGITTRP